MVKEIRVYRCMNQKSKAKYKIKSAQGKYPRVLGCKTLTLVLCD